ncbi:amidohydrolase family protein [Streptomyces sp. NBC_00487]|uniref:amidohydrolase family protein n=2 Tax=Streptomyces TaxID=1883 RepID=UPI002E17BE0D|nr:MULTISPECIES: amidohydrolase family protein [unclassified Streptomyces]
MHPPAPAEPGRLTAVRAANIFDGDRVRGPGTVFIRQGVITGVETANTAPPCDAAVHELGPGSFLLPGLIDAHSHLCWNAGPDAVAAVTADPQATLHANVRAAAARALRAGITTVRDLGDRDYAVVAVRDAAAPRRHELPELLAAGPPLTTPRGHCHFLGGGTAGAHALRRAVRERFDRGCHTVKVMASGGSVTPGSDPSLRQFTADELRAVAEQAHALGMNTAAHAHAPAAILDAARAGFATVEHVSFMTGDRFRPRAAVIDALVSAGTFASLTAGDVCADRAAAPPLAAKMLQCLATVLPPLRAAGARIVLGSDAGIGPTKPHDALVEGVRDAVRLGVDGAAALRMVTGEAAEACGVQGRKGRLAPGADADLLVLGADPVLDMAALTEVRGVYRLGHPVHGHDAAPL